MAAAVRCPSCGRASWMRGSKGSKRAAKGIERHRRGNIGTSGQHFASRTGKGRDGGGRLRAVDQREPFLRRQCHGSQPGGRKRGGAGLDAATCDSGVPFTDQHERQVGQGSKVAARADRAAARHHGMHAAIEHREEQIECLQPNPRKAFRENVGSQRHRRSDCAVGQRSVDAGGVTAEKIRLQRPERFAGNWRLGKRAKSSVDAVHRRVAGRHAIHHRASEVDATPRVRRETLPRRNRRPRREAIRS